MSTANVAILFFYAIGMSLGQLLFKLAADRAKANPADGFWIAVLSTRHFYLAIALYGLLTVAWVWILMRVPLSRAYPFVVLAFVLTPLLAAVVFGESLDLWYAISLMLILSGLGLLVLKGT